MAIPISQVATVASYVLKKKLAGVKRYPLVLMLEPLFRCSLACAGCGKVQYPPHILKKQLTPEECFAAVEECGAPMVSIPGGEPLLHPQFIRLLEIVRREDMPLTIETNGLLCTPEIAAEIAKSPNRFVSVSIDGADAETHEWVRGVPGAFEAARQAVRNLVAAGIRPQVIFTVMRRNAGLSSDGIDD